MKRQRIVAAWLACIMAAFVLPFAALAEGGGIAIKLDSGNAELAVGDYLSVNVKFDAAVASFGGAEFNVEYDSTVLEFMSYTALLGSAADEDTAESGSGTGMLNYGGVKDGKVKILLVNAGIISGGDTSIAAKTVIGNIVFKVIGQNTTGTSYKIASEEFSANHCDRERQRDLSHGWRAHGILHHKRSKRRCYAFAKGEHCRFAAAGHAAYA